jgi:hypothetical protein
MTKKTNKEMYSALIAIVVNAEMTENDRTEMTDFLNTKIEQLEKKASTVTKAQREKAELNGKLAQLIIEGLTELDKPVKISELIKGYEPLNEYSTQKITPIITALVDNGKVERATVKREKLYSIKVVA